MQLVLDLNVPGAGHTQLRLTGTAVFQAHAALQRPPEASARQLVAAFDHGVHVRTHDGHTAVITKLWRDMVLDWRT